MQEREISLFGEGFGIQYSLFGGSRDSVKESPTSTRKTLVPFVQMVQEASYIARKVCTESPGHNYSDWMNIVDLDTPGCDLLVKFVLYSSTRIFFERTNVSKDENRFVLRINSGREETERLVQPMLYLLD